MVRTKKGIGILVTFIMLVGCLTIAPFVKADTAYADPGLQAGTQSLQTETSKAPTTKLAKKKLYSFSTTIYFIHTMPSASKWYSSSNKKTAYEVEIAKNSSFAGGKSLITYKRNYTKFSVSNAKVNVPYYFRVRLLNVINGTKYYGPWSKTYSHKISKYTPSQRLSLKATAGTKSIKIHYSTAKEWITSGGGADAKVSGYEIWWTNSDWSNKFTKFVKDKHTTDVTLNSLTAGKRYSVAVRLYNTVRGVTYYGPWSAVQYATPKKG